MGSCGAATFSIAGQTVYSDNAAGHAAQAAEEAAVDPNLPTDHEEFDSIIEPLALGAGTVLLFRGLNPTVTSKEVDDLGIKIAAKGYEVAVFNYQNEKDAEAKIKPEGALIMIGFSAGCQPVRNISLRTKRPIDLIVMIDGIASIGLEFLPNRLPANVNKAYNFYNPRNYGAAGVNSYGSRLPPSNTAKVTQKLLNVSHSAIVNAASAEILTLIPKLENAPTVDPNTPNLQRTPPVQSGLFTEPITTTDMARQISRYFLLTQIKMQPIDTPQRGLRSWNVANNWVNLCRNVLDPAYDKFKFKINSGFRTIAYNRSIGSRDTSDHCTGGAVDLSMGSQQANIKLFRFFIDNKIPFSQLIFEGNWVHVAYGGAGPKGDAKIMWTFTGAAPLFPAGPNGEKLPASLR
jgi:hypothetical protein